MLGLFLPRGYFVLFAQAGYDQHPRPAFDVPCLAETGSESSYKIKMN